MNDMPTQGLNLDELETLWTLLAGGIAAAGPERESVFLSKLAILLANELGDYERVAACVRQASRDQRPASRQP